MTEQSSIRHTDSHLIDTFRDGDSSTGRAETRMTPLTTPIPVHPLNVPNHSGPNTPTPRPRNRAYVAAMTSAKAVLAAIDERKPNLPDTYKHNLLFFCQGHHLATHSAPLFDESLRATPAGATLVAADLGDDSKISKRALGMIGWVMHRYGAMFPVDLRSLVTVSTAWQRACSSTDNRIEQSWLTDWFSRPDELSHEGRIAVTDIAAIIGAARS